MKTYIYPQNLKAKPHLWLWGMRDFVILAIAALLSVVLLVHSGLLFPLAGALCFAFMTIRMEDTTVMDYLGYAAQHFVTSQKYYEWSLQTKSQDPNEENFRVGSAAKRA